MDRTTKRLVIALAVSVSLNLFFVGFGVGRRAGFRSMHGGPQAHGMALGPAGFLQRAGLRDAGPEVEKIMDGQRAALRTQRDAISNARGHVIDALQADPFDGQRFATALEELRTQSTVMQTQMHAAFVEVAKKLSPEQRKRVAKSAWFLHQPGR